uniref:F-box domain-containing protein n=1 Tax=Setaria italica TaxID=4555 RepID=K3ZZW9_SETIT
MQCTGDPSLPCENNRVLVKGAEMMQPETTMKRFGGLTSTVDRLSALPDALLHAILSFLPAPQVVRTCLLSQRRMTHSALGERWARFEDFATNLLLSLDNNWIRRGIEYCPAALHVLIPDYGHSFKLPPMASSSFHRLKRLRLVNVDLDGQFADLLSACPVMEDLDLAFCKFPGNINCSQGITSSTLKKLVWNYCENSTSHPMVITAPSLSCLNLTYGCYQAGITLSKMESLVEAMIEITETLTLSQNAQRGLLCSLFNVTSLQLMGFEAKL